MTVTATAPRVLTALQRLVLVRLAVPRNSPYTVADLTKTLTPFCEGPSSDQAKANVADTVQALIEGGKVARESKRLTLTEAGKAEALAFLGIKELPANLKWSQCLSHILLPKLLGADPSNPKARKKLLTAEGISAALLIQQHNLPLDHAPSYSEALTMVLCRELGIPPVAKVNANVLARWLLEKKNGERRHIADRDLPRHVLFALVQGDKADLNSLRQTAIRRLLHAASEPELFPESEEHESAIPFNLSGFAEAVLEAARSSHTGWLGDNKVLISHVWKQLEAARTFPRLDYPAFQQHLVTANQDGLLHLSRLDLVDLFPSEDVAASQTKHHNAVFHLVQI
jgi:hypothetical protein